MSVNEDKNDFAEQLKNLTDYAHTEINNLYSLIDGLDKKVLHIEIQENYQSQYSINERLDKLERHEMQAPLSYDDVIDIKRELNELKKLVNDTQNRTISNTKNEDEFKKAMNDEPTSNDSSDLKEEKNNVKKHLNTYSAPLRRKSGSSKDIKRKLSIPVPPSSKSKNTNSPISNELIQKVNEEQKEIIKLDSETKKALNNSYDAKAQASEASYVAAKAKDQASEANSKVDELSSHDKEVDTKIKHIKSKVRKLSRKVDDIETSTQSEIKNGNKNSEKTVTEKVSNSKINDTEKVSNSKINNAEKVSNSKINNAEKVSNSDTEKSSPEKSSRKENSKSEKSEKKEKPKIRKLKSSKLKIGKKKEKNEEESLKKKISKAHISEKSSKKENH